MEPCLTTVAPLTGSANVVVGSRGGKLPQLHRVMPHWLHPWLGMERVVALGSLVLQESDPGCPAADLHLASSHLWFTVLPAREPLTSSSACPSLLLVQTDPSRTWLWELVPGSALGFCLRDCYKERTPTPPPNTHTLQSRNTPRPKTLKSQG